MRIESIRAIANQVTEMMLKVAEKYNYKDELTQRMQQELIIHKKLVNTINDEVISKAVCYQMAYYDIFDPDMLSNEDLAEYFWYLTSYLYIK